MAKTPQARLDYIKRWQRKNRARRRLHANTYYLKNKDKINRVATQWGRNNPDKKRESNRRFYKKNRKAMRARSRNWSKSNPDKVNIKSSRRRALQLCQVHEMHSREKELTLIAIARNMTTRTGIRHGIDHIIPLARGGWHHHENMQVMPCGMNSEKNDNPFWERKGYKSWRDVPEFLWPEQLISSYRTKPGTTEWCV